VLGEAIERIEEELSRRENLAIATTTQADLSRHALELKLSRPNHPGSGRTASEGMKSKERQKLLRVGPASAGAGERMSALGHKRTLFAAPFDVRFGPESGHLGRCGSSCLCHDSSYTKGSLESCDMNSATANGVPCGRCSRTKLAAFLAWTTGAVGYQANSRPS